MATSNEIPKTSSGDYAHALVKGAIGAVPIVGSAGAELFTLIVSPPLENRKKKWMEDIGNTIESLKEAIDIEKLSENEAFIDAVTRTTQIAIRTSQKEKHQYLKNALLKVIKAKDPDIVLTDMFIQLIDRFNVWHINLLELFDDPGKWYEKHNKTFPNITGALDYVVEDAFPELKGRKEFYSLVWTDLFQSSLTNTGGLGGMMSNNGLLARRTSELGRNFLKFIQD